MASCADSVASSTISSVDMLDEYLANSLSEVPLDGHPRGRPSGGDKDARSSPEAVLGLELGAAREATSAPQCPLPRHRHDPFLAQSTRTSGALEALLRTPQESSRSSTGPANLLTLADRSFGISTSTKKRDAKPSLSPPPVLSYLDDSLSYAPAAAHSAAAASHPPNALESYLGNTSPSSLSPPGSPLSSDSFGERNLSELHRSSAYSKVSASAGFCSLCFSSASVVVATLSLSLSLSLSTINN